MASNLERFADIQLLRYDIPSWDSLTSQQQHYAYYLCEAGSYGRDIIFDQNYQHNLLIRDVLEQIYLGYKGFRGLQQFQNFEIYLKRFWFSRGFHHHYSSNKFLPDMSPVFFRVMLKDVGFDYTPYEAYSFANEEAFADFLIEQIFEPTVAPKKVNLNPEEDMVASSAVNFYQEGITQSEVEAYYESIVDKKEPQPISYGLNSRLTKKDTKLQEEIYKVGGKYSQALSKIVENLELAAKYAESETQKKTIELLVAFYQTGDLKKFDEYSIAWVKEHSSVVALKPSGSS